MTHQEIIAMIREIGYPFAYSHFAEGEAPDPPFICFLYPSSQNFGADDIVYHSFSELNIEVYTDHKDPEIEAGIEDILTSYELFFEKSETWIATEKLYEVLYTMIV